MLKKSHSGVTNHLDYLIYICLCCWLIIDSITGILLQYGGGGISAAYKSFVLFLIVLSVFSKNLAIANYIMLLFLLMVICLSTYLFSVIPVNYFFSIGAMLQLISNQLYFVYFYYILKSKNGFEKYPLNNFLKINILVFLANIFLGILGFGFYTYRAEEVGIRGFFYAGNQVSVLFYCLYYIVLVKISPKSNKILFIYVIALVISILIATMTTVLSCILISVIDYYFRSTAKKKFYLKLFAPVLFIILTGAGAHFLPRTAFWRRAEFAVMRSLGRGEFFLEAILSGRIRMFRNNYEVWQYYSTPSVVMFGLGSTPILPENVVEIDFFDTFFRFGLFFTFFVLAFYLFLIYLSVKTKNYKLFFFNLIYLGISFTAGHVWVGVMAGLFYAYINAYELNLSFMDTLGKKKTKSIHDVMNNVDVKHVF